MAVILRRYERLGSTNDEAFRLAQEGASHGTVVVAAQQTAGRGRQGRSWVSPPGNIHASFLFRTGGFPGFALIRAAEIGFVAAVGLAAALDRHVSGVRLKWPNDVLLGGAKLAGVLTEITGDAIIVGIGVNVAHVPPGLPYPVTSLAAQGVTVDADGVLHGVIEHVTAAFDDWDDVGFDPVRYAWVQRGPALGAVLRVRVGVATVEGGFAGLGTDGALLLAMPAGLRRVLVGEVL